MATSCVPLHLAILGLPCPATPPLASPVLTPIRAPQWAQVTFCVPRMGAPPGFASPTPRRPLFSASPARLPIGARPWEGRARSLVGGVGSERYALDASSATSRDSESLLKSSLLIRGNS